MSVGRTVSIPVPWRFRFAIASVAMIMGASCFAQDSMMLFGIVTDAKSGKPIPNASLLVITDSIPSDSVFSDPAGSYQVFVPLGSVHRLVYYAEGAHQKVVEMDCSAEMEPADRNREWNIRIDITLVTDELELSADLLETPVGRSKWIAERHAFEWDTPYSERYQIRYKQEVKAAKKK